MNPLISINNISTIALNTHPRPPPHHHLDRFSASLRKFTFKSKWVGETD